MKHSVRPTTLKALRERRGLSQAKLEARSDEMRQKVGIATIKRIETWTKTEMYMASQTVAERLAKALGVAVEDLAKEPSANSSDLKRKLRKLGMRQLRVAVGENTSLAFRMVEHLYGIPVRAQIEMAPLCMALLAEGSLAWRRQRLEEIKVKADALRALGSGNFAFAKDTGMINEGIWSEEQSIQCCDVFGEKVHEFTFEMGYDPNTNNPFADYLRELARNLDEADIALDPDGIPEIEQYGFPEYRIGTAMLDELAGGDPDAEYTLACGHVKLADVPDEMLGEDNTEKRVEWIVSHIPEDELAERKEERAKFDKLFANIRNDISTGDHNEQGGHSQ